MRALIVYCHPDPASFNASICALIQDRLAGAGAEIRVRDLYAQGFDPVLNQQEWRDYMALSCSLEPVAGEVEDLRWCDTLIFVYPTWWYGLPAMLKGWLDRVFLPNVAFLMPDQVNATIRPGLQHITRLGVFTTCGASLWLTSLVGAPGKRTLLRGVGYLCAPTRRTVFAAHYLMDSSTQSSRQRHLVHVGRKLDKLLAPMASDRRNAA